LNCYKITLDYEGTDFKGWQIQKSGVTVQGFLEQKLLRITGEHVRVHGAGRTDSGVHAKNYVAHFYTAFDISGQALKNALNSGKREDIIIKKAEKLQGNLHARFDAQKKRYLYCIVNTNEKPVFHRRFFWRVGYSLDIDAMKAGAKHFVGTHDFSAFRASTCSAKSPIRTVTYAGIHTRGNKIYIGVHGRAFLQYMVRNIVGTLVDVGRGRFPPEFVAELIENRDRSAAGPTAPPHGLFLMNVLY